MLRALVSLVVLCTIALVATLAGQASAVDTPTASGAPAGHERAIRVTPTTPAGFDDMLRPRVDRPKPGASSWEASASGESDLGASDRSAGEERMLWERLQAIPPSCRAAAAIELEPRDSRNGRASDEIRGVEALWRGGLYDEAIDALRVLEPSGELAGLGIAWTDGKAGLPRGFGDVRIGGARVDGRTVCLDYDTGTGHLFGVVQWGSTTGTSAWTTNISTDRGATWAETYSWTSVVGIVDVDAAVVGDRLYVGYLVGNATGQLRFRRCLVTDGSPDAGYSFHVAIDATPATFSEIAVASNAADYDNRIYGFGIDSDHALRFVWDVASDGTTFTEDSPAGVANASAGLSATWNHQHECDEALFVSYAGTDGGIHVQMYQSTAPYWTDRTIETAAGTTRDTSVSSWGQFVICAFEFPYTNGTGVRYRASYDCGQIWNYADLAEPEGAVTGYLNPSVDARSGAGTAIVYQAEMGEPDVAYYRYRSGYAPGLWSDPEAFNDHDVLTGSDTAINSLANPAGAMEHGAIYLSSDGDPWYDRLGPATSDAPMATPGAVVLRLLPAAPNPAGDRATVRFVLSEPAATRVELFDVAGRRVAIAFEGFLPAGAHDLPLDGRGLEPAVYFYRLTAGGSQAEGRVVVVR